MGICQNCALVMTVLNCAVFQGRLMLGDVLHLQNRVHSDVYRTARFFQPELAICLMQCLHAQTSRSCYHDSRQRATFFGWWRMVRHAMAKWEMVAERHLPWTVSGPSNEVRSCSVDGLSDCGFDASMETRHGTRKGGGDDIMQRRKAAIFLFIKR